MTSIPHLGNCLRFCFILLVAHLCSGVAAGNPMMGMEPLPAGIKSMKMSAQMTPMNMPQALDWRDSNCITPAGDQGNCGSCYVFAATAVVEAMAILSGASVNLNISEQDILSCANETIMIGNYAIEPSGCAGGYGAAVFEFLKTHDAVHEDDFAYQGGDCLGNGVPLVNCYGAPPTGWNVDSWHLVGSSQANGVPTTDELKSALQHGPLWVGYMVHDDFMAYWLYGNSDTPPYSHTSGGSQWWHAVLLVGYDNDRQCFVCKNSWGETSGPFGNGTFEISYNDNCYFGRDAIWIEVSYTTPPPTAVNSTTWGQLKMEFGEF
jgi:Papain family cysteine protease